MALTHDSSLLLESGRPPRSAMRPYGARWPPRLPRPRLRSEGGEGRSRKTANCEIIPANRFPRPLGHSGSDPYPDWFVKMLAG